MLTGDQWRQQCMQPVEGDGRGRASLREFPCYTSFVTSETPTDGSTVDVLKGITGCVVCGLIPPQAHGTATCGGMSKLHHLQRHQERL